MAVDVLDAWRLHGRGQYELAIVICNKILVVDPDSASALCCRGICVFNLTHETTKPLVDLRRAVKLESKSTQVRHNFGVILAAAGKNDAACRQFKKALKIQPTYAGSFYNLTMNKRFKQEEPEIRLMREIVEKKAIFGQSRELALFGLAKAYDDLGMAKEAMEFISAACAAAPHPFDMQAETNRLSELKQLTKSGRLKSKKNASSSEFAPVFIVGMPRSGTTLVESILARHPDLFAGGELSHMPNIERDMQRQMSDNDGNRKSLDQALLNIDSAGFGRSADAILTSVKQRAGREYKIFTDKMPHNASRVGLISKIFPKARIIHVRRHPLDTGISNYFMRFASHYGYSYDLSLLGQHIRNVAETMDCWRDAVDIPILDVRYEDLIANSEFEIRRMLAFSGLKWDEKCLNPEQGKRQVMTASLWQVRQPMYNRSVARWKKYEAWIGPMIEAMGGFEWIDHYQNEEID